ncbi:MAG: division/cell wall cluster transcriptional repressor MraZ [Oscillospiraceae bacterium]|jgi:MraZ protein|nr:division/cell wall cluster transcriptional repressor MraZ [Oscillospiraceae bacterium]
MDEFWSKTDHGLDAQKRLVIPKDIRPLLGERFAVFMPVLSVSEEVPHLVVMPEDKYNNYISRVRRHYAGQMRDRQIRKLSVAMQMTSTDSAGRVTLSEALRKYAGLDGKVAIVGCGKRLELWSPEKLKEDLRREVDDAHENEGVPLDDEE